MVIVNGWTILAHPLFLDQVERLATAVEALKAKDPENYRKTANAKLLAALEELVFKVIPANPALPAYRQGKTLGESRKHWYRAKFGGQRFRLFFRYGSEARIIIFAWVNDEATLRTYGSRTDAYAVFKSMLADGNPPDGWGELVKAASEREAQDRLAKMHETSDD